MGLPGRDGDPLELEFAHGRGNVTAYNINESMISRMYARGIIGMAEKEAGDLYGELWHLAAIGSLSPPDPGRVPGQRSGDATAVQIDTINRLNKINRELSRVSYDVLFLVMVRGASVVELRRFLGCPKKRGIEAWVVRQALMELAEVTGHASKGSSRDVRRNYHG